MSPYDIEDDFGGGLYPSSGMYGGMYGLTEEDKKKARNMGLMSAGLGILAANQPSPHPKSALGVFGQGGLQGLSAYQGDLRGRMAEKSAASGIATNEARMKSMQQMATARTAEQQAKAAQQQATAAQEQERMNAFEATLSPEQRAAFRVNPPKFMEEYNRQFAPTKPEATPNEIRLYEYAQSQGFKGTLDDWITGHRKAGASNVNLTTNAEKSYGTAAGTGFFKRDLDQHEAALGAAEGLQATHDLLNHLRTADLNTGMAAEIKLGVDRAKVLAAQNEKAGKRVSDTELLDSMLGSQVFPMIQSLGIGARGMDTPAEREFLRKVMTGTITMNKETLVRMAEIRKNVAERAIDKYNARVDSGELDRFFESEGKPKRRIEKPKNESSVKNHTEADLRHTAMKYGISVEEVKKRLGLQ
jgi:hypothetical protein